MGYQAKPGPKLIATDRGIVDLVRSIMYAGANDDNENMIAEVEDLAKLLAERDEVPSEPNKNRLLLALNHLRDHAPKVWKKIEHINDD